MLFGTLVYYVPVENKFHIAADDTCCGIVHCREYNIHFIKPDHKEIYYVKGVPFWNFVSWDEPDQEKIKKILKDFKIGKINGYSGFFTEILKEMLEKYPSILDAEIVND